MKFRNDRRSFGAISIVLHWTVAATVLAMLFTGLIMALAPDRSTYLPWVKVHASLGSLLWPLIAMRIGWHFAERRPEPLSDDAALHRVAGIVHVALLALIATQIITGPLDIWSGGFALDVFGMFALSSPIGHALDPFHDAIGRFHAYVGLTIAAVLTLHLAGVAKHVVIDRDGTLGRMFGLNPRER